METIFFNETVFVSTSAQYIFKERIVSKQKEYTLKLYLTNKFTNNIKTLLGKKQSLKQCKPKDQNANYDTHIKYSIIEKPGRVCLTTRLCHTPKHICWLLKVIVSINTWAMNVHECHSCCYSRHICNNAFLIAE